MTSSFTLLETVAVQAIKGVHGGTDLCQMPQTLPEVLAPAQEKIFNYHTSYSHNFSD